MNVLWVVNVPTPESCDLFDLPYTPYGGWLVESSKLLSKSICNLSLAFPALKIADTGCYNKMKGAAITYYQFQGDQSSSVPMMESILLDSKPDVVHIYGTEMLHTSTMIEACDNIGIPYVLSIQGLVSVYSEHVYGNLPCYVRYLFTLRNIIKRDTAFGIKKLMEKRGEIEVSSIKKARNVIGRTLWDQECVKNINPDANYFHCNETLRSSFYSDVKWSRDKCGEFVVFVSQGHYPVKGVHNVIKAISILKKEFPSVRLVISGKNTQFTNRLKQFFLTTYYDKYVGKLIDKYNLAENVKFVGPLNENEIHTTLLNSHVYVCSSSIENSPNSLGEAMITGVPCVTSFVGGIPSLADNEKEVLFYQHDAPYMLAAQIKRIFQNDSLAKSLTESAINRAESTHSSIINNETMLNVYNQCIKNGSLYV